MLVRSIAAVLLCLLVAAAAAQQDTALPNGDFEQVGADGVPSEWKAFGPRNWELSPEAAHGGQVGLRMRVCDRQQWLRQQRPGLPPRTCLVSGWFKANAVACGPAKEEHIRLYVHLLYEGRPYSDGLQAYRDIPAGTYDWRRFAVRVVPNPAWKASELWVTVTGQFHAGELSVDDIAVSTPAGAGGASVLDWENGAKPIVVTDMSQCQPATALADHRAKGKWKVLDYESGPYTGKLISANYESGAPPVALPLPVKGWHAIYVGVLEGRARLKLASDPAYVGRVRSQGPLEEVFFKAAALDGDTLRIAQQTGGTGEECAVAYVKLVPLTAEEVTRLQQDRRDSTTRRIASSIDGFSYIYSKGPVTVEELLEEVEEYRDSDIGTVYVCVGGAEMVNYASRYGTVCGVVDGRLIDVFPRAGDRIYSESVLAMMKANINPTRVHIEGAKKMGLKVHASIRPGAWEYSPNMEEFFASPFYRAHPEWRCVDRDGTPVSRMSLAVPEVRRHLIDVLREAVEFGADGANLIFVRGVPYVLWEKPFCDLFRETYHEDALQVPENDERITRLRVQVMTDFMREVRAMLDAEQARRGAGPRLDISAFVLANEADNMKYGIDVRGWVEADLLDELSPYRGAGGGTAKDYDLAFFKQVCEKRQIPWRPTVIAWSAPQIDDLMQLAVRYYDAGASGLTLWDGNSLANHTAKWAVVSRLGHVEELRRRAEEGAPAATSLRMQRVGGVAVGGRYSPNWGY